MKKIALAAFLTATMFTGAAAQRPPAAPGTALAAVRGAELTTTVAADYNRSLKALWEDLHAHPELSFVETRTAGVIARKLRAIGGIEITEGVGKTGVVGVIRNGAGPTVLLRADMDGLPVIEQTGLPFASTVKGISKSGVETGVMHACGHDTHMSAWVGTARQMVSNKDKWSGTLVMILQPAEEIGSGARAMLADGLYTRFAKPKYVMGFHDAAIHEARVTGTIGNRTGTKYSDS